MRSEELIKNLQKRNLLISTSEILDGRLDKLREDGLRLLNVCIGGKIRSVGATKSLVETYGVPAIYLMDGILGLQNLFHDDQKKIKLIDSINLIPLVPVIMFYDEAFFFKDILKKLSSHKRFNQESDLFRHLGMK